MQKTCSRSLMILHAASRSLSRCATRILTTCYIDMGALYVLFMKGVSFVTARFGFVADETPFPRHQEWQSSGANFFYIISRRISQKTFQTIFAYIIFYLGFCRKLL